MGNRIFALALLFAGCFGVNAWVRAPQEQTPPGKLLWQNRRRRAQNRPANRLRLPRLPLATETTEYPLD